MQNQASFTSVIRHRGFLNLWVNQILIGLSYNSLNFALIIWVFKLTESNSALASLLFTIYFPAVLFGLFAGVLVDVSDRKNIVLIVDFLLSLAIFSLVFLKGDFLAVLAVSFFINSLVQFHMPAESSAIPLIVPKPQLLAANSIFSTTLFTTYLIGYGLAGPLINQFGIDIIFIVGAINLFVAFALSTHFPSIKSRLDQEGEELVAGLKRLDLLIFGRVALDEIRHTAGLIRGKLPVLSAIAILAGVQMIIGVIAVLIPSFLEKVLQISAADASYVIVMPLGIGMVLGALTIGRLGHRFSKRGLVGYAISSTGALFLLQSLAPILLPVIRRFPHPRRPLPFIYHLPHSLVLAIGSIFLGAALVSIVVSSQTVLQENTPDEDRGKVFSVLGVATYGLALLPVIFAGILSDVFGPVLILFVMGVLIFVLGTFILKPNLFFGSKQLPSKLKQFLGLGHWKEVE